MMSTADIGAVGSKLTSKNIAIEALSKFLSEDIVSKVDIVPTDGGVNNIVQYINMPTGEKKLLRIYNNGLNSKRVNFEHEVLRQLNDKSKMSFRIPCMIPSMSGETHVKLSNGAEACMVEVIPGGLPKLTCVEDIGRASGELNSEIAKVVIDKDLCNCAPYYDMWEVHHAVTRDNFIEVMNSDAFDAKRAFATKMIKEVCDITDKCEGAYQSLPQQLIHGDLHYDNVLVEDGKVTGLLDFEFAAFDWRAMELAICLSKYAGEPNPMHYFDSFIAGYATTATLTRAEALAIPDLINLRILSNVVYFVGRKIAGEDDISSLTTRIETYCNRVEWVKANAELISNRIIEKMKL
jgi:homoserine kinase type II